MGDIKMLVDRVLAALYAQQPPVKVALAATGGGASAAPLLFRAGSSSSMLHFSVPYARASLQHFLTKSSLSAPLEQPMPKFVSRDMAERMAEAAWHQAQQILWDQAREDNVGRASSVDATLARFRAAVGVGCTASLATSYDRRGLNEAFISLCRAAPGASGSEGRRLETFHVHLDKSLKRTREEEDRLVSEFVVYLLAKTADADPEGCAALLDGLQAQLCGPEDRFTPLPSEPRTASDSSALSSLNSDGLRSVAFLPANTEDEATVLEDLPFKGLVLPGSFNPLHQGHVDLALAAQRLVASTRGEEMPIAFEIAVSNADKGAIDTNTTYKRVRQFTSHNAALGRWPVVVTNATLFSQKSRLLCDCIFVVGVDTAVRLVDKKYYGMDEHKMVLALRGIADRGCSFVVAGRFDEKDTKRFISAEEVCSHQIPAVIRDMFIALREEDFRNDLSSTQLRKSQTTPSN